jgi:hypothetical protein
MAADNAPPTIEKTKNQGISINRNSLLVKEKCIWKSSRVVCILPLSSVKTKNAHAGRNCIVCQNEMPNANRAPGSAQLMMAHIRKALL